MIYFRAKDNNIWGFKDRDVERNHPACDSIIYHTSGHITENKGTTEFSWCLKFHCLTEMNKDQARKDIFLLTL